VRPRRAHAGHNPGEPSALISAENVGTGAADQAPDGRKKSYPIFSTIFP
jgi:hypothetical protein